MTLFIVLKQSTEGLVFQCLLVGGYVNFYPCWEPFSDINCRTELNVGIDQAYFVDF